NIQLADDVVAKRVHTPFINDGNRVHDVAGGLAYFLTILLPPSVNKQLLGQGKAHRLEHDRPINRVEFQNVLADDVNIRRPEFDFGFRASGFCPQGVPQRGVIVRDGNTDVIHECIEPDVGDKMGIERQRNAPVKSSQRTGDAKVLEFVVLQEAEHFVAAGGGLDEVGVGFEV